MKELAQCPSDDLRSVELMVEGIFFKVEKCLLADPDHDLFGEDWSACWATAAFATAFAALSWSRLRMFHWFRSTMCLVAPGAVRLLLGPAHREIPRED